MQINPALPEESLVFVSISSGEEDQNAGLGEHELGAEHKGVSAANFSRLGIRSEDGEKALRGPVVGELLSPLRVGSDDTCLQTLGPGLSLSPALLPECPGAASPRNNFRYPGGHE